MKQIQVFGEGAKETFRGWIVGRGGIRVWDNMNLSDPSAGPMFTPAFAGDGKPYPKPHWSRQEGELVTSIDRFQFVLPKEVKRIKIAVRMGAQGLSLKLTDASSRKLNRAMDKIREEYGIDPVYHFEGREAVISIPGENENV